MLYLELRICTLLAHAMTRKVPVFRADRTNVEVLSVISTWEGEGSVAERNPRGRPALEDRRPVEYQFKRLRSSKTTT